MLVGNSLVMLAIFSSWLAIIETDASIMDTMERPFRFLSQKAKLFKERSIDKLSMRDRLRSQAAPIPQFPQGRSSNNDIRSARDANQDQTSGYGNDEYKAMCVFSRGPSLKSAPALFYFSPQVNTKGCEVEVEIELASRDNYRTLNESFARESIRNKLINTGYYDGNRPTFFMTHGFLADWKSNWLCDTKDLILSKLDANIFIVDWSGGSKPMFPIDYGASVSNTPYVATLLGQFIELLLPMTKQRDASRFHLIGHSLGAHISGFVGYSVGTVGQITALDPAGPCFTTNSHSESESAEDDGMMHKGKRRLSPQSANFVLALHTDTTLFGLNENCAHYDVYVNGGVRQPNCGAVGASNRLEDLLHLNLLSSLNLDLTCCHSYAHKLLDTFVDFASLRKAWSPHDDDDNGVAVTNPKQKHENRCYPMAYQCLNWDTFKAGECGFCFDNDTRCVFTGVSRYNYQVKKNENDEFEQQSERLELIENGLGDKDDDDIRFNSEYEEDDTDEADPFENAKPSSAAAKYGQHFMRAGAEQPICVFHYQILVAAKRDGGGSGGEAKKHYYYLHIPLENGGRFHDEQGNRLHDRLVQVSHKIEPSSPVYESLRSDYMNALSDRLDGGLDELGGWPSRDDVEFYSALITFRQAPADDCTANDATNGAAAKDKWQLCDTLRNIREARLWSSSSDKLKAVRWVSMNYMSGVTFEERMSESYALLRDPNVPINRRDEIEAADQAKLSGFTPRMSNGLKRSFRGVAQTAECFLSLLDIGKLRDPKQNYRCRRSSDELKYAVELRPQRLHW